jgi:hypothetical protein
LFIIFCSREIDAAERWKSLSDHLVGAGEAENRLIANRETAKKLGGDDHNPAEQPSTLVKGPENVLLIHFSILLIRMYVLIPFDSKLCLTIYFVK